MKAPPAGPAKLSSALPHSGLPASAKREAGRRERKKRAAPRSFFHKVRHPTQSERRSSEGGTRVTPEMDRRLKGVTLPHLRRKAERIKMLSASIRPPQDRKQGAGGKSPRPKEECPAPLPHSRRSQSKNFQPKWEPLPLSPLGARKSPSGVTYPPAPRQRIPYPSPRKGQTEPESRRVEGNALKSESPSSGGCLRVGPPSPGTLAPPLFPPPRARAPPQLGPDALTCWRVRGAREFPPSPAPPSLHPQKSTKKSSVIHAVFHFSVPPPLLLLLVLPRGLLLFRSGLSQARTPKRELVRTTLSLGLLPGVAALSAPGEGRAQYLTPPPRCSP